MYLHCCNIVLKPVYSKYAENYTLNLQMFNLYKTITNSLIFEVTIWILLNRIFKLI